MKGFKGSIWDQGRISEFRLMVLGDVLALPIGHGDKLKKIKEIAKKDWIHPDGHVGKISIRTLQRWLQKVQNSSDRIMALTPPERKDKGQIPSVTAHQRQLLRKYWQERPENHWQNHYRNLQTESKEKLPSFSSVKRFLRTENLFRIRDENKEKREKLLFEASFVNQVWHLDCHHGSCNVVDEMGSWRTAKLIVFLDDRSRFACHAQWYLNECCREMCSSFEQGALKCGLPHSVYTDNGSGMRGSEFREGLSKLGVILKFTQVESPYQNGKLERFWGTLESQLLQMVPKDRPMTLPEINRYTHAWLNKHYHIQVHSEIKQTPEHLFFNEAAVPRRRIALEVIRSAFRRSIPRKTRTQDGTVKIEGIRFQLPPSYRHISQIIVRYASWNLGVAELVDAQTGKTVAEIYPVDKKSNSHGARQELESPQPKISTVLPGIAPYLEKLCKEIDAETGIANFNPTIPIDDEEEK